MRRSQLQRRIMLALPEGNLTKLAKSLGVYRSSVSRCLYYLSNLGLVYQECDWQLTDKGKQYLNEVGNRFELAKNISWQWGDALSCFDCECGEEEIILSEGGQEKACECGRIYRMIFRVEVKQGLKVEPQNLSQ